MLTCDRLRVANLALIQRTFKFCIKLANSIMHMVYSTSSQFDDTSHHVKEHYDDSEDLIDKGNPTFWGLLLHRNSTSLCHS